MEDEKKYLVTIETRGFWDKDLNFEVSARNSQHAIVKVAKAFEKQCKWMRLEELDVDGQPLKHVALAYRAVQMPEIDLGDLLENLGIDVTWR